MKSDEAQCNCMFYNKKAKEKKINIITGLNYIGRTLSSITVIPDRITIKKFQMRKSCFHTSTHVSLMDHTHYLFLNGLRFWARTWHDFNRSVLTLLYWKSHAIYTHSVRFRIFRFCCHKAESLLPNNVSCTAVQSLTRYQ